MGRVVALKSFWLAVLGLTGAVGQAHVGPPDVYRAVAQLRADLELIRVVMGRQSVVAAEWDVLDARPRHVFYQAQTLHRKANRLAWELADAARHAPPSAPAREIEPADVLGVVQAAHEHIRLVKAALEIDTSPSAPPVDPAHEPKDVLQSIIQAGRQLNRLVDTAIKPSDVYRRLELAVGYSAGMAQVSGQSPALNMPTFEPGKMPRDVFGEVLRCLEAISVIGERNDVAVLKLNVSTGGMDREVVPADVYDLVTTLLSDVIYLSWRLDVQPLVPPAAAPARIFPSHVYQIARMLNQQLKSLVLP